MEKLFNSIDSSNNCVFVVGYDEDPPFLFSRHWNIEDEKEKKIGIVALSKTERVRELILQGKPIKIIFLDCSKDSIEYRSFKAKAFIVEDENKIKELKKKYENFSFYIIAKIIEEL